MARPRLLTILVATATATAGALVSPALPGEAAAGAGPGISLRGSTAASAVDALSVVVPTPRAVLPGDVLVARVANRGDVDASVHAEGWTEVGSGHSAAMLKSVVLTRVATASEPAGYAFQLSRRTPVLASVTAFDNVDPRHPVDGYVGQVNGNSSVFRTPTVRASVGNAVAVWLGTQLFEGSGCREAPITQPSGFVEALDSCLPGRDGLAVETSFRSLGAAGARAGWQGRSPSEDTNLTQVVTLRPEAPVQAPDVFAGYSVDVGALWDGTTAAGAPDTALPDAELHEPSGLAASRVDREVLYAHSEADQHGMVALSSRDARVLGRYQVQIPQQRDWEDIATGPCPTGSCLFAGDIGNARSGDDPRSTFAVYRVPEPDLAAGQTTGDLRGDWFRFRYPDGPHNAEALMVHPTTGGVYVVTKETNGAAGVYAFPEDLPAPSASTVTTLTRVASLRLPRWTGDPDDTHAATWYAQVTAASIHPVANRFLVRTPYRVWEFRGAPGGPFSTALSATPVALTSPSNEGQGEAVEYAPDGSSYYTLGEQPAPPFTLKRVDRR